MHTPVGIQASRFKAGRHFFTKFLSCIPGFLTARSELVAQLLAGTLESAWRTDQQDNGQDCGQDGDEENQPEESLIHSSLQTT
jgi:hypothetical protein